MRKLMLSTRSIGLVLFVAAISIFTSMLFIGKYEVSSEDVKAALDDRSYELIGGVLINEVSGQSFPNAFQFSEKVGVVFDKHNEDSKAAGEWDRVLWDKKHDFVAKLSAVGIDSPMHNSPGLWLFLTFGLGALGGLLFVLPGIVLLGPPGIRHDGIFHSAATNRGWIGWIVFGWLVSFYIVLYFYPDLTINWAVITDPLSFAIKNKPGDRWFLYGLLYCTVMTVMAIRMFIKYRGNKYQILRTSSVLFFQIAFAFMIPELLSRFNMPAADFKNIWPLDYDFFFGWNLDTMLANGTFGIFMLFWGLVLIIVVVPVMVYFFGKRWYCSWVCGCGGLAETLGDPYRQLSDKSMKAWKIERYLIHGVLVFAIIMTGATLYTWFSGDSQLAGFDTYDIQKTYGFLIGSVFSGVIGTGFYPVMGSRVWCRFGCPLAAYLGLVQRFKSRFRITTNGGQCISCGNCSTHCEMGIDVRAYAQRGQNIVRSSCVGCGVCASVCPRGVLKLENGPEEARIQDNPILIGREGIQLSNNVTS
jgi:polyferredoxin